MKLNYRNTFYVGLIFFIIALFWQTYDMLIARTLIDKYGLNQTWSGIVMAADNIMAVILLPLFGALSDKSNSKLGKRTPYIIVGTVLSAFAFMALSYTDYMQTLKIQSTDIIEEHYDVAFSNVDDVSETSHWYIVVDNMENEREQSYDDGLISRTKLNQWKDQTRDEILDILDHSPTQLSTRDLSIVKDHYYRYLSDRAWEVTAKEPTNLIIFSTILFIALVSMSIFRSPAVALMPDVTIKSLRSKANAVITLMGAFGGILAIYILMLSGLNKHAYDHHSIVYIVVGVIMLFTLGIFLWKVKEPKLVERKNELDQDLNLNTNQSKRKNRKVLAELTLKKRISLYLLLTSIFFLFTGYNAVMSKLADYLPKVLNLNYYDPPFVVAQVLVVLLIVPIGLLSMSLGRKKTIILGLILLIFALSSVVFLKENQIALTAIVISVLGIGWAMISINAYVMVVEMSKGSDIGRYTGFYYAASMSAQIFTPIFSGILMDRFGRIILFPYAAFFTVLSLIFIIFVKHGEAKKLNKNLVESFETE